MESTPNQQSDWKQVFRNHIRTENFESYYGEQAEAKLEGFVRKLIDIGERTGLGPVLAYMYERDNRTITLEAASRTRNSKGELSDGWSTDEGIRIAVLSDYHAEVFLHEALHQLDRKYSLTKKELAYSYSREFSVAHNRDVFHLYFLREMSSLVNNNGKLDVPAVERAYENYAKTYNKHVKAVHQHGVQNFHGDIFTNPILMPPTVAEYFASITVPMPGMTPEEAYFYQLCGDPAEVAARGITRQELLTLRHEIEAIDIQAVRMPGPLYAKLDGWARRREQFAQAGGLSESTDVNHKRVPLYIPHMTNYFHETFYADVRLMHMALAYDWEELARPNGTDGVALLEHDPRKSTLNVKSDKAHEQPEQPAVLEHAWRSHLDNPPTALPLRPEHRRRHPLVEGFLRR